MSSVKNAVNAMPGKDIMSLPEHRRPAGGGRGQVLPGAGADLRGDGLQRRHRRLVRRLRHGGAAAGAAAVPGGLRGGPACGDHQGAPHASSSPVYAGGQGGGALPSGDTWYSIGIAGARRLLPMCQCTAACCFHGAPRARNEGHVEARFQGDSINIHATCISCKLASHDQVRI